MVSRLDAWLERYEWPVAVFLLLLFFARAIVFSRVTLMSPDELLTYVQARLATPQAVLVALRQTPTALDPPLYPLLSWLALHLPFSVPLSLRIPSFIAYAAFMLSLFILVRRLASPSLGLVAMILAALLPAADCAIVARPYALVLACAGWALVFWQHAAQQLRRLLFLVLLGLTLACAISAQYLAPLLLAPFVAAELWRGLRSRFDPGIWFALALATTAMLLYLPFLPAAALYKENPWHGVMLEDLRSFGQSPSPGPERMRTGRPWRLVPDSGARVHGSEISDS